MFKTAIKERTFAQQRRDSTLCGELPIPYEISLMWGGWWCAQKKHLKLSKRLLPPLNNSARGSNGKCIREKPSVMLWYYMINFLP